MRQYKLQVFLALIVILGLVEAQVTQGYIKSSEGVLRGALERKSIEDLEVLYKEAYILKSLDESKLESLSQPLCALLQLSDPKIGSLTDAFYLQKLKNILSSPCSLASQNSIESTLSAEFESIQTAEQVLYVIALAAELNKTNIQKAACIVAPSYLQLDGTAKADFTNPNSSDYLSTGLILEAIQICIEGQFLSFETLKKQLDIALESILLNSVLIEPKRRVIMHNMQTLELTAKLTKLFTVFPNKTIAAFTSFENTYKNTLLNYIRSEANSNLLSTQEKFEIVALQKADLAAGVIVVDKNTYNLKLRNNTVLLRFENILGEQIQSEKNVTATLFLRTEKVIDSLIAKNNTDEKFPLALTIPSSAITKAGFYSLRITVGNEEVLQERILFTTTVNLKQVEFEAAQGKGKIPKKYTHSLTAKQLNSNSTQVEKIIGNQNTFLYVQFSLDYVKQSLSFTPSQVAVRLRHPTFTGVTHLVEAEYDDVSNVYLAIVDFGDPLTILPYSAIYDIELIIADQRLTKPVQKIIAQIDATFKTARNGKAPPNDADFIIPKPIEHVIVDTIQSPPIVFILGFIFMMAVTLLSYFAVIHKIKLNDLRLKNLTGIQSIYVLLFAGSLLAAFGLLVVFWVKINLLQTVTYITIGIIPFILIGNAALNSLSQADKENDSQDSD